MTKPIRYCKECGKSLGPRNETYCSNSCFRKAKGKTRRTVICKVCGKEFTQTGKRDRIYCSNQCCNDDNRNMANTRPDITKEELNRPFTSETPYLVWLWHNKHGDGFELIAMILNRSVESVKEAYNKYVQEVLKCAI